MKPRPRHVLLLTLSIWLAGVPFGTATGASAGEWEGEEALRCTVRVPLWGVNCHPYHLDRMIEGLPEDDTIHHDRGYPPTLPGDNYSRVTLTIEWVANSPDTRELVLTADASGVCGTKYPGCAFRKVEGTSPLSVTFEGIDAATDQFYGRVGLVDPCQYGSLLPECGIPVRVAIDQTYTWRWTFE